MPPVGTATSSASSRGRGCRTPVTTRLLGSAGHHLACAPWRRGRCEVIGPSYCQTQETPLPNLRYHPSAKLRNMFLKFGRRRYEDFDVTSSPARVPTPQKFITSTLTGAPAPCFLCTAPCSLAHSHQNGARCLSPPCTSSSRRKICVIRHTRILRCRTSSLGVSTIQSSTTSRLQTSPTPRGARTIVPHAADAAGSVSSTVLGAARTAKLASGHSHGGMWMQAERRIDSGQTSMRRSARRSSLARGSSRSLRRYCIATARARHRARRTATSTRTYLTTQRSSTHGHDGSCARPRCAWSSGCDARLRATRSSRTQTCAPS